MELVQTPLVRHARVLVDQNNSMMCPVIPPCMLFFSLAQLKCFGAIRFFLGLLTLTLAVERTQIAFLSFHSSLYVLDAIFGCVQPVKIPGVIDILT